MKEAVERAIKFVGGKAPLPILSHVLISAGRAVACDLTLEAEFAVDKDHGIEAAVPAEKIKPILAILDEAVIEKAKNDAIVIRHGKSHYRMPVLPAADFPRIKATGSPVAIVRMPAHVWNACMSKAVIAAATNDIRFYINGVLIENKNGEINIVATDGYRLIAQRVDDAVIEGRDFAMIVPRTAAARLSNALAGEATISVYDDIIVIQDASARFAVKRIDGNYPLWRGIVVERPLAAIVEKSAILDAIRIVAAYADEKIKGVNLVIGYGEITIVAKDDINGCEAKIAIPAETVLTIEIGVNVRYLLDAVQTADRDLIGIYAPNADLPMRIEPPGMGGGYAHVVMPMRV